MIRLRDTELTAVCGGWLSGTPVCEGDIPLICKYPDGSSIEFPKGKAHASLTRDPYIARDDKGQIYQQHPRKGSFGSRWR